MKNLTFQQGLDSGCRFNFENPANKRRWVNTYIIKTGQDEITQFTYPNARKGYKFRISKLDKITLEEININTWKIHPKDEEKYNKYLYSIQFSKKLEGLLSE